MAAGFTNEQAEAVTGVVRDAQSLDIAQLTTKADLQMGLAEMKADFQIGLAETKAGILKWMVGTIGIQTVVIIGAVLALVRMAH